VSFQHKLVGRDRFKEPAPKAQSPENAQAKGPAQLVDSGERWHRRWAPTQGERAAKQRAWISQVSRTEGL